jgi:aspartate aminotransferase
MTGLRVGYAAAEADLIRAMSRIHYVTTSCASSLSQFAALAALKGPRTSIVENAQAFKCLAALAATELSRVQGMTVRLPGAGLYVFANCEGLLGSRGPDGDEIRTDLDLVTYLDRRGNVQVMPGTLFGLPGHLRITCGGDEGTLREGIRRIVGALSKLQRDIPVQGWDA